MPADDLSHLTPDERAKVLLERFAAGRSTPATSPFPPAPVEAPPTYDADLIPEAPYEQTEEDRKLDGFLEQVDVILAYRTFCGKMEPEQKGSRTEGIMISCPMPGHADANPSAWLNTEKGTWFCGGCQVGGDSYDLAAIDLGYTMPNYKTDGSFPKLRREMANRLGFTVVRGITGTETFIAPDPAELEAPVEPPPSSPFPAPPVVVTDEMPPEEDDVINLSDFMDGKTSYGEMLSADVLIDWEKIVSFDTFLRDYMDACTIDDLPHEFHFMNGLIALGFASGRDVFLKDFKPVKPNLYVCLYGRTGVGKSRSIDPLLYVLDKALPYTETDHYSAPTGVLQTATPASAEALIDTFKFDILDPSTNAVIDLASIRGLVKVEELSGFIARSSRMGSSMRETLIEMYDIFTGDITLRGRVAGQTRIRAPFVQMLTTTQPKAIHSFLRRTDTESGFLNRYLFGAGKPRRDPIAYGGVEINLSHAVDSLQRTQAWAAAGHQYVLQGAALEVWSEFFHRELAKYKSGDEEMDSMVSRVDLTLKKFIILLTVNECLDQPSAETVERAVSLYDYLTMTYSAFSGDISFNDVTECQNRIIYVIDSFQTKYKRAPSSNQIRQQIGKKFDLELVIRALKNLVTLDVVVEQAPKVQTRGRPTKRYSIAGS